MPAAQHARLVWLSRLLVLSCYRQGEELMMSDVYFESAKTKKRYVVVKFDTAAGKVRLKGVNGLEFEEKFDPSAFKQMGYTLKQGTIDLHADEAE